MIIFKLSCYTLACVMVFTSFMYMVPQFRSEAPLEDEGGRSVETMNDMIALGEAVFRGKGNCSLCHDKTGRAPDLPVRELGDVVRSRIDDEAYRGLAAGTEGGRAMELYLRESSIKPSAYVVPGYGKKGSRGQVSPMPDVRTPPIELSDIEVDAVIAFLQDYAGVVPTLALPSTSSGAKSTSGTLAATGEEALEKYACTACHGDRGSDLPGPSLDDISLRLTRVQILAAILDPDAALAPGYEAGLMPADIADQMQVSELRLVVDHLASLKAK